MIRDFVDMNMEKFVEKYSGRTDYVRERAREDGRKARRASGN
jgi:cell division protein FtsB